MLTIPEAFAKFKSNLEPSQREREDASRRQKTIRGQVEEGLSVATSFLAGSYIRETAVRPLKDVDIMVVLSDPETEYLDQPPTAVLDKLIEILEPHYPGRTHRQRRSVNVQFGVKVVDDTSHQVVGVDVVPAFADGSHYTIPDTFTGRWMPTNPKVHQDLATMSNAALDRQWVPMVKMIKKANSHAGEQRPEGKPVKPSFLLEVMAHTLLPPPWTGPYPLELRQFFASAADLIDQEWPDPAGLGPAVSDRLQSSPADLAAAKRWLGEAVSTCDLGLRQARNNQIGAALGTWQTLFGPLFVKS